MENEFRVVQDGDAHWYVIPADREEEWGDFCSLDPDDEEAWNVPEWADAIGGSPSNVVFRGSYIY